MRHEPTPKFVPFDKDADLHRSERSRPHWFQSGVTVFVTFRTNDSMPREVMQLWERELREWLSKHEIRTPNHEAIPKIEALPESLRQSFLKQRHRRWNLHLDNCHGACLLKRGEIAQIVSDSLLHFNQDRYDLDRFVIMPNHVHLLAQFRHPTTCRRQCESWLRYTATKINRLLHQKGAFWQSEPFDHLVRSSEQFEYLQRYIENNPAKARLKSSECTY